MKKTLLILLGLLLLAAPAAVQAQAQDYEFTTNADGISLTIVYYIGPGGDVTIPNAINGLPVTIIATKAFEESGLTSVTIPDSVVSIGSWAFFSCDSLTSVNIAGSVTNIGDSAFDYCTSLAGVTIPEGVTAIGDWAFADCTSLSGVSIPDSVNSIGVGAFFECESLTNVIIPAGVTSIGVTAFYNCTSLANVTIPGSVTSIGIEAFQSCTSLTNLTLASGVTNIEEAAFDYCINLASVTLPDTLTTIGVEAFQSCTSLTNLVIPASVTNIGTIAFTDCTGLANVYFQGNAPTPGSSVFLYDTNAKAFYLPGTTGWKSTFAGIPAKLTPINIIKVEFTPPEAGATVTGAGHFLRGSNVTVTASSSNDCYEFVGWRVLGKTVSTNLQYTFTVTNTDTLVADFALLEYVISASSSPTNWGTTSGGGKKGCGATATLRAAAKPGFAFTEWTSSLGATITNEVYKFSAGQSESFVANFVDIKRPTVTITAPKANEKIGTAAFAIEGKAADNASVAAVYYNLNETGWQLASSSNNFASWFADVTLATNSANTVSAYAEDASGNLSLTNGPIKFTCTAQGLAPLSIGGVIAEEIIVTNAVEYVTESFASEAYVKMPASTNDGGEIGTYTYTPTGPDTGELARHRVLPSQHDGPDASVLVLTFTDAYNAAFTNLSGGGGNISFAPAQESVPATLDGEVAIRTSFVNSNFFSTNSFGASAFTTMDSLGRSSSGTYTFTKFTPVAALLLETYSSPADRVGTTNYVIMTFKEGSSHSAGVYYSENVDASGKIDSDIGSFR
jgi:hypothetical protein